MYYLKCNPRSFYHKKAFSCEKVYHFFGLTLQVFYQFFKSRKSQITWVTQMRKIYIYIIYYCKEYYFNWLVDLHYKIQYVQPTGFKV